MTTPSTRWTGHAHDGVWFDAANWSAGVPVTGENAVFGGGASLTISLEDPTNPATIAQAGSLIVRGDQLVFTDGTLDLAPATAPRGNTFDIRMSGGAALTIDKGAAIIGTQVAQIGDYTTPSSLTVYGLIEEELGVLAGGQMTISGPAGHWQGGYSGVDIGYNGTLTVQSGGLLDAGPGGLAKPASDLMLGDNSGNGTALVTGAGSIVRETGVFLGFGYGSGYLTITNGGTVIDNSGGGGSVGDAYMTVTGPGSTWINHNALTIGGQVPVNSHLTITQGATVTAGREIILDATLTLDPSAVLNGPLIISGGGAIQAQGPDGGTVTLSQNLYLSYNPNNPFSSITTFLQGLSGTALVMTGHITGGSNEVLDAAIGHITLSHADNSFYGTQIYGGALEIAAEGAAGAGKIQFTGGTIAASLTLDSGVTLPNIIGDFATADTIDLRGLAYASDLVKTYTPNNGGGILTIADTTASATLHFAGNQSAATFTLATDGHGGTLIGHI